MRLSNRIVKTILEGINHSFGDSDVYLFGSRVDDNKRGGDIDIAVDTDLSSEEFSIKKIEVITFLVRRDFDFKIDMVPYRPADELLLAEIESTSVLLQL